MQQDAINIGMHCDVGQTLKDLMDKRYPVYAKADVTVHSRNVRKEAVMRDVLKALAAVDEGKYSHD